MKKCILFLLIYVLVSIGTSMSGFASTTKEFQIVPIYEEKSKIEFARVVAPQGFDINHKLIWERNFENPVKLDILVSNKDKSVQFYYFSPKTYADVSTDTEKDDGNTENSLRVFKKKFKTPDKFVLNFLQTENPNAKNIKLVSVNKFSVDYIKYLTSQLYTQMAEMEINAKSDSKTSKIVLSNPYVQPYIAEYTYTENGKIYRQMFITMFSSVDFDYITKTSYDEYNTVVKKLWHNHGFAYIKAEEDLFNDNLDSFSAFVVNSSVNKKAEEAVEQVKKQMIAEINPQLDDHSTGITLQNMPSELFIRYYFGGTPDYSEKDSLKLPSLNKIGWLVEYIVPQASYSYRKISNLYNQKLHFPKKYSYVYYNTKDGKIIVSDGKQKVKSSKRLKAVKVK